MLKKIKPIYILIFFVFATYVIGGYFLSFRLQSLSTSLIDYYFNMDSLRVFNDISEIAYWHWRITVHPLFLILCQTVFHILSGIFIDKKITIIFLQAIVGVFNIYLLYRMVHKLSGSEKRALFYSALYGFSFSSLLFAVLPETYIFAASGLLMLWNYSIDIAEEEGELKPKNYLILICLGVLSYGITLTNLMQFFPAVLYVLYKKKYKTAGIIKESLVIIFYLILAIVFLSKVQKAAFPNSHTFWEVLSGKIPNHETLYMDFDFSIEKLVYVLKAFFFFPFLAANFVDKGEMLYFSGYNMIDKVLCIGIAILYLRTVYYAFRRNVLLSFVLSLAAFGNLCLHFLYGSQDTFLYSQHWFFLLFLLLSVATPESRMLPEKIRERICFVFFLFITARNLFAIYRMAYISQFRFGFIHMSETDQNMILLLLFLSFLFTGICFGNKLLKRKVSYIVFCVCSVFICQLFFIRISTVDLNPKENQEKSSFAFTLEGFDKKILYVSDGIFIENLLFPVQENFKGEMYKYKDVLYAQDPSSGYNFKLRAEENVLFLEDYRGKHEIYRSEENQKPDFFIFGLGIRNKYILKKNKVNSYYSVLDYTNGTNILEDIAIDYIDPVQYKAEGKMRDGSSFAIYESGEALRIETADKTIDLSEGIKINIPAFEGKYHDRLRILFHEAMSNITRENGPLPNFFTYSKPSYRNAATIAMLCRITDNEEQIRDWISSLDEIYDYQKGEKEADNLGELLFLQSFLEKPSEELTKEAIQEAYRLRREPGIIIGSTDFSEHPIYQTAWLKYGMESLGMDSSDWILPAGYEDSYSDLLWFYDDESLEAYKSTHFFVYGSQWQYINFARAAFYEYDIAQDDESNNSYPMSYETADSDIAKEAKELGLYAVNISAPQSTSAAEMFLYYYNLDK